MKSANFKLLQWLWKTSKGLRLQASLNTAIYIVLMLLDFAFIYSTKWVIDIATGRLSSDLRYAAASLVCIIVVRITLSFCSRWISAILGVRSQNTLQLRIFTHLMNSQLKGMDKRHSGDTLNRLERDVSDITSTLTETLPSSIAVSLRLVGAFMFLYSMDHRLAVILLCISPSFGILSKLYVRKMRGITREIRQTDSRIQSLLQESLQNHMVLKTLERCQTMTQKLDSTQQELRSQIKHKTLFSSTSATILSIGFSTGYLVTFLWGVNSLQEGVITYGTMLAFIQLVGQIQSPFRDMSRFVPAIVSSITAAERLMELEDTPLEEVGEPVAFPEGAGIRLKDVEFSYDSKHRKIIQDLTYDFPIGSTTAILGETGAGKTTLIRLILALHKPDKGSVEIYDSTRSVPVSPCTRTNLVYVPQGNTLFSGTIRDNLLLGNPDATEEEMRMALHTACADFILERPGGLDAVCGEQGAGLSEGQAQRIAIARAMLRKGCILLLDEATSALDTDTERQLLRNLQTHSKLQTVICITHRPAMVEYCSQVLRLSRSKSSSAV